MADFYQNGTITTLQKLGNRSLESLEDELNYFAKRHDMVLMLPALFSEFSTPAMEKILSELRHVKYLKKVILGLDQANEDEFIEAKRRMRTLQVPVDVIWNDGPRIQALYKKLQKEGFHSLEIPGKGRNVWTMIGYAMTDKDNYAFALHDCDIVNYSREVVARLFYPIIHPALDLEFNKGYYSRVTDRLHGRATRLFIGPLIHAIEKTIGPIPYLEYLKSFRYALSGEFAFIRSLARGIRISPTWGLEVATLSEVFDNTSSKRICQSEIMQTYEHKHQNLGSIEDNGGIVKMANEIAQVIFRTLAQKGVVFTESTFQTIIAAYFLESRNAILKYNALSKLNGLTYVREDEISAVEVFEHSLKEAADAFLKDPMGIPMLSAWITVRSVLPDFSKHFAKAVREDNDK
jgi:glucosyl-3-phosphoglycerate synthase